MIRFVSVGGLIVLLLSMVATAAEPIVAEGRVDSVIVYQGQALVTRKLDVPKAQGLVEVVVTNLPENILPGSLFAEPTDGVQVRSVRYRARPIEEDVREEVRELDQQIQEVQDKLTAVAAERTLLNQRKSYLLELEKFSAGTSRLELKSGVLNAETLKDLTQFLFTERDTISKRELELAIEERTQSQQRDFLARQRDTIAAGSARTVREAVVFINAPQPGDAQLRISYLVTDASWTPSYNLRANASRDEITVEYNASIEQMSGEDWNDVEMVLSTATPSLVASAPKLQPLLIKLGQQPELAPQQLSAAANYRKVKLSLEELGKRRGSEVAFSTESASVPQLQDQGMRGGFGGGIGGAAANSPAVGSWDFSGASTTRTDEAINTFACSLQLLDFNNSLGELRGKDMRATETTEGVSVSYRLANRTSLPSRSDRQLIQIASLPFKGDFYRLAAPVLTSFVYEEARLTNDSEYVFLAGPVATFMGGQFVGRGDLPTVAVGESFTVGLGIDSSLRAGRQLVTKEERVQGGNRVADFVYQLALENFGGAPAKVRLLDRLPTTGEDDIKVTLVKSDEPVSDDAAFQMADRKEGILRWDVEVPAQAIGPKQKTLSYTMQIEYDKQLAIVGMLDKR